MATYTITVTDVLKIASITNARNEYNDQLQNSPRNRPGGNNSPPPTIDDNQSFLQMVIDREIQKYVAKFGLSQQVLDAKQAELDQMKAKFVAAGLQLQVPTSLPT